MAFRFDQTITLGSLISTATIIAGLTMGWATLQSQQSAQGDRIARIEGALGDYEQRMRLTEITQAGQSSDLRNIQIGINEIKASLDRLSP